jgi:hypothetical protein
MSKLLEVELFWDGDGYYYANLEDSDRLGGPFDKMHAAWKDADNAGLEVVRFSGTRGRRLYRNPKPKQDADSQKGLQTLSKA